MTTDQEAQQAITVRPQWVALRATVRAHPQAVTEGVEEEVEAAAAEATLTTGRAVRHLDRAVPCPDRGRAPPGVVAPGRGTRARRQGARPDGEEEEEATGGVTIPRRAGAVVGEEEEAADAVPATTRTAIVLVPGAGATVEDPVVESGISGIGLEMVWSNVRL